MVAITRKSVHNAIARYFPDENPEDIISALDVYGEQSYNREVDRVQYAILKLSDGDMDMLLHLVDAACQDYRDVLFWDATDQA